MGSGHRRERGYDSGALLDVALELGPNEPADSAET
jgi:hypothetical protein